MKSHFETEVQGNSEMAYLFSVVVGISFWPSVSWVASFRCSVSWAVVQKMMSKKKKRERVGARSYLMPLSSLIFYLDVFPTAL